jgi:hypothetical protein
VERAAAISSASSLTGESALAIALSSVVIFDIVADCYKHHKTGKRGNPVV